MRKALFSVDNFLISVRYGGRGSRGTQIILLPEDDPEKQRPEAGNEACQGVEKIRHPVFELPGGNWSDLS